MEDLIIRNRKITDEDLPVIQAVVNEHWDRGRTHVSSELCKHWNWVQPSGRLKYMAFAGDVPLACYQASNWIRMGETRGTAKKGRDCPWEKSNLPYCFITKPLHKTHTRKTTQS